MPTEALAVIYGLLSAAIWGAGDFSGGVASKRSNTFTVVIFSQVVGILLLIGLALAFKEPFPSMGAMFWGGVAGVAGGLGLILFYRGLSQGRMGIVAPVAGVVSATIPVVVGLFIEGLPGTLQLVGFGLAITAVWFVSQGDGDNGSDTRWIEIGLPVLAGIGFAVFLIVIDRVSESGIFWPLVGARIMAITVLTIIAVATGQLERPPIDGLPLIVVVGAFDMGGNAFYALAAAAGRLDIAAVLGSLYPASTILLARFLLKERMSFQQSLGVVGALVAIVLIAA